MKLSESYDLAFAFANRLLKETAYTASFLQSYAQTDRLSDEARAAALSSLDEVVMTSATQTPAYIWNLTVTMPPAYILESFKIIGTGNALEIAQLAESSEIAESEGQRWLCIALLKFLRPETDYEEISEYIESIPASDRRFPIYLASIAVANRMHTLLTQETLDCEALKAELPSAFFLPKMEGNRELLGMFKPSQRLIVGAKITEDVIRTIERLPNMGASMTFAEQEKLAVYASIAQSQFALGAGIYEPCNTLGSMKELVRKTIKGWNDTFENTVLGADAAPKIAAVTTLESLIDHPAWEHPILKEGPAKKAAEILRTNNAANLRHVLATERQLKSMGRPASPYQH